MKRNTTNSAEYKQPNTFILQQNACILTQTYITWKPSTCVHACTQRIHITHKQTHTCIRDNNIHTCEQKTKTIYTCNKTRWHVKQKTIMLTKLHIHIHTKQKHTYMRKKETSMMHE